MSDRPRASKTDGNANTSAARSASDTSSSASGEGHPPGQALGGGRCARRSLLDRQGLPRARAHDEQVRGRHVGRHPREGGDEVLEALAAQQPARVGDHERVRGQAEARAGGATLSGGRADGSAPMSTPCGMCATFSAGTPAARNSSRMSRDMATKASASRRSRLRAPVPARMARSSARARVGLAPGVDLARHLAVHLRLEDDALPRRARDQHAGQAEHARAAHDEHVVGSGRRRKSAASACGTMRYLPVRPGPGGGTRTMRMPSQRLLGRPRALSAAREHGDGRARAGEVAPQGADVTLAAAQDRMERLGEEEDADQRPGVTRSRSGSGSGCAAGGISFTT